MAAFKPLPQFLRDALEACRTHVRAAILLSAFVNLLYLAPTIYMMQVYDRVVPTGGLATLGWITLVLGLTLATLAKMDNLRASILNKASLRLNHVLAGPILAQLVSTGRNQGTRQAMREFDLLRQVLTGPAAMALFDAPWTPIYFLAAFLIHPALGLAILACAALLVTIAIGFERRSRGEAARALQANAAAYQAQEALANQAELIAALGMRKAMVARQQLARAEGLNAASQAQIAGLGHGAVIKFARMFMQSLALGLGAWLAIDGLISVGTIIAASVLLSRALQPVEQLVANWGQIAIARQALGTLQNLLDQTSPDGKSYQSLPAPRGKIEASGMGLLAPGRELPILNNVSLTIAPGEMVGLIGPSGAGKSTLARILSGAIAPQRGEVRIDGARFVDWEPDRLASHIGAMPQQSQLLPGTIGENISRFAVLRGEDPSRVSELVIAAARKAGMHEAILRFPGGYEAQVGAPQAGLSGGQVQRLALARALYADPAFLVLDEPGAALDGEGERALVEAIQAARARGAAILIISHQPQLIALTDRLIVLKDGMIDRHGPSRKVIESLREPQTRAPAKATRREAQGNV